MISSLRRCDELSAAVRGSMFALLADNFDGVDHAQFERELAEKEWVVFMEDGGGRLQGFSTFVLEHRVFEGEPVACVYSGDTIVDRAARGSSALSRRWIEAVWRIAAPLPGRLYWLLLTSGYRTYRFLPVFWREFYPRWDRNIPDHLRTLRDVLARGRYGEHYDEDRGVVRFPCPHRLPGDLAHPPGRRADDPHIAYFLGANPGHDRGDELVCITELSESNLTAAGRRMVVAGGAASRA